MLQDDAREVLRLPVAEPRLRHVVDELVVFVHAEDAVRRDALHREGTGDADLPPVLVGLVVEVLEVGPPWPRWRRRSPAGGRCGPPTTWCEGRWRADSHGSPGVSGTSSNV